MVDSRKYLTEIEVQSYMFQLIQGVKYIHNNNIIHRDLKPENIFLDEKMRIKIGDFGLLAKPSKESERFYERCGTMKYMAPEVFNPTEKGYSYEVDIWSLGIIMYNLLTGEVPFSNEEEITNGELFFPEEKPNSNDNHKEKVVISDVAKDLIRQILAKNYEQRPGLNQILHHDFFHLGKFPRYPNISTLRRAPTLEEIKKYNPHVDLNGRINGDFVHKELYKLAVEEIPEIKYKDIDKYSLKAKNPNIKQIDYWVTFCHKSHYNFLYYEINNGLAGIIYKKTNQENIYDGIHLIYNEKNEKLYEIKIGDLKDEIISHNIKNCPNYLQEKKDEFLSYHNKILQKRFDDENKSNFNQTTILSDENSNEHKESSESTQISTQEKNEETKLIYIKDFEMDKYGKFLLLSDETYQIIFKDRIEIMISNIKKVIGFIDKERKMTFLPLINIWKNENRELKKRIKYIKKVNFRIMKNRIKEQYEKNENEEISNQE